MTAIALITLSTACATHGRVQVLAAPTSDAIVTAAQTGASRAVEVRNFRVSTPAGETREILVARETGDGAYWWVIKQPVPSPPSSPGVFPGPGTTLFTGAGRIATILPASHVAFHIQSSAERAASLDDAQAQIVDALERAPDLDPGSTLVDLGPHLGREFGTIEGMASHRPLTIQHVAYDAGRWTIVVKGFNGDTAEVTLGDDHRILSVTRRQS